MNKQAITSHPINDLAINRWSPRAFLELPVEEHKLVSMFEAARWSASGGNEQPWRFIIGVKEDETWQKIFSTLNEGNQVWCKQAPVLLLACANMISSWDGGISPFYQYDAGQAVAHMSLEAVNQGLYLHQMGGFSGEKAAGLFGVPEGFSVLTAIAVGYLGDPGTLPENLYERELQPRSRKPLSELVFSGNFGEAAAMIED